MDPLAKTLRDIVGEEGCLTRHEELFVYECDGLTLEGQIPSLVVFPAHTREVVEIVRACVEANRPFVPRGAGTGLSGGAHPVEGAVVIECSPDESCSERQCRGPHCRGAAGCRQCRFISCGI